MSESRKARRTQKTRKGGLGISRYFHSHQVSCKKRTEEIAKLTYLLAHLYRRELYTLALSDDKSFIHPKVTAKHLVLSSRSTFILIVQRITSSHVIKYLLRIVSFQCCAERRNERWLLPKKHNQDECTMAISRCLTHGKV